MQNKHFEEIIVKLDKNSFTASLYCKDEDKQDWNLQFRHVSPIIATIRAWECFNGNSSEWKKYGELVWDFCGSNPYLTPEEY